MCEFQFINILNLYYLMVQVVCHIHFLLPTISNPLLLLVLGRSWSAEVGHPCIVVKLRRDRDREGGGEVGFRVQRYRLVSPCCFVAGFTLGGAI